MNVELLSFNKSNHIVAASVELTGTTLSLEYNCSNISDIVFSPYTGELKREWCLWEHTCFEAFINFKDRNDYLEFNFSSSGSWSCYHLDSYREGIKEYNSVSINSIQFSKDLTTAKLVVKLELSTDDISQFNKIGITTILNDGKTEEFWSLQHPEDKPDFHSELTFKLPISNITS